MNATRAVIPNKPPVNAWTCGACKRLHSGADAKNQADKCCEVVK